MLGGGPVPWDLLQTRILEFARLIRRAGIRVTTTEVLDAVRSIPALPTLEPAVFRLALRTCLVKRKEEYPIFDSLYLRFWEEAGGVRRSREGLPDRPEVAVPEPEFTLEEAEDSGSGRPLQVAYSPLDAPSKRNLRDDGISDAPIRRRLIRRLVRHLATREGRRLYPASGGDDMDLRRTIRASLGSSGEILQIIRSHRRLSRTRLVVFCDVSGSMDEHSEELLRMLHSLRRNVAAIEILAFSTEIRRITHLFERGSGREVSGLISEAARIWGSGTRIGHCLRLLLSRYPSMLDSRTVVVIVSDGWDLGEKETLQESMAEIRRRSRGLVWLNPLLDLPGYEPATIGMTAALPFIDLFASSSILGDPGSFERFVGRTFRTRFPVRPRTLVAPRLDLIRLSS